MWSGPLVDVMERINSGQLDAWSEPCHNSETGKLEVRSDQRGDNETGKSRPRNSQEELNTCNDSVSTDFVL